MLSIKLQVKVSEKIEAEIKKICETENINSSEFLRIAIKNELIRWNSKRNISEINEYDYI